MYFIKENVDLKSLEKYGFKIGKDMSDNERWIFNDFERSDYWLTSMCSDEPERVCYADGDDHPMWSIHIQSHRRVWIDCVPPYTFHIDNMDMDKMFYVLKCMIEDGIIEDHYTEE